MSIREAGVVWRVGEVEDGEESKQEERRREGHRGRGEGIVESLVKNRQPIWLCDLCEYSTYL